MICSYGSYVNFVSSFQNQWNGVCTVYNPGTSFIVAITQSFSVSFNLNFSIKLFFEVTQLDHVNTYNPEEGAVKKPLTGLYACPRLLYTASYKTFIGVFLPTVSFRLSYTLKAAIGFTNGLRRLSRKKIVKIYKSSSMHQYQCNSRGILKKSNNSCCYMKCCLYSVQQKHIYQ